MIKDGESYAIIHEIDIVYMWVDASETFIECDACDRSHGWEDLWSITGFDYVTSSQARGNTIFLYVGTRDLSLLKII